MIQKECFSPCGKEYRIALNDGRLVYQTTMESGGHFDLCILTSASNPLPDRIGYTAYLLSRKSGKITAKEYNADSALFYDSAKLTDSHGNEIDIKASALGEAYVSAVELRDIDFSAEGTTIVIHPWVISNGDKTYGAPLSFNLMKSEESGCIELAEIVDEAVYHLTVSDDTYIGGKYLNAEDLSPHGSEVIMDMKNADDSGISNKDRQSYYKFTIDEAFREIIAKAEAIRFEFCGGKFVLTPEETARGGVEALVSAVDTAWTENNLTRETADSTAGILDRLGTMFYGPHAYYGMDVTAYVKSNAPLGAVAFRVENVNRDGVVERTIKSKEANDGRFAPRLVITTPQMTLPYQLALTKHGNRGAEPWSYAEMLVDEWFGGEREAVYTANYGELNLKKVDNNSPCGDYTLYNPIIRGGEKEPNNNYVRTISTLTGFVPDQKTQYDEFGGIVNMGVKGSKTGFFHTEITGGKHYLIDPLGNPFYSMAVNTVNSGSTDHQREAVIRKYGSEDNFHKDIVKELKNDFGLNTVVGSNPSAYPIFMQNGMPCIVSIRGIGNYMKELGLSVSTGGSAAYFYNDTMNIFEPDFINSVDESVKNAVMPFKDEPYLLGYTADNEIPGGDDILTRYLTVPAGVPANAFSYATAWTWLKAKTGKITPTLDDVTMEYSQEFLAFVYNRYGKVISDAIHRHDPNHMYLGSRANTPTKDKEGYIRAMGRYVDLFTVNMYGKQDYAMINTVIEKIYRYSGKPIIISEFGMRALDSADMNGYRLGNHTNTACWLFETQEQRAASYESYVLNLLESGVCLGWTLYRFRDNDQSLYRDAEGNIYTLCSRSDAVEATYSNVKTNELMRGIEVTMIYKGEADTSNLSHNKGIYDNHTEPYPKMQAAMKAISDNLAALLGRFDG